MVEQKRHHLRRGEGARRAVGEGCDPDGCAHQEKGRSYLNICNVSALPHANEVTTKTDSPIMKTLNFRDKKISENLLSRM